MKSTYHLKRIDEKAVPLRARRVEVALAEAGIALDAHAGARELRLFAQRTRLLAPLAVRDLVEHGRPQFVRVLICNAFTNDKLIINNTCLLDLFI